MSLLLANMLKYSNMTRQEMFQDEQYVWGGGMRQLSIIEILINYLVSRVVKNEFFVFFVAQSRDI